MQFNSSTKSTKINIGNLKKSNYISLNSNNTDSVYEEIDYSNPENIDITSVVKEMVSNNTALEQSKQLKGILEERKEQLESKIDYLEYLQNLDELYGTESSVPKVGVFYPQTFEDFVQSSQTSESSQDLETSLKELKQDYEIICALIPKLDYEIKMSSYEYLKSTLQYQDYVNNYTCEKDNIDYDLLALYNYDITSYINEITRGKSNEEIQTMIDNGELKINPLSLVEYLENNLPEGKTIDDIIANMTYLKDMSINYKYMTEDEKMMYHYLFDTEGEESANEYMSLIQDKINQAHGVDLANDFLNTLDVDSEGNLEENVANILGVSIEGLGDGIDNFFNGIENAIINNEKLTAEDYKKMIILQTLQEQSDSLTWRYQFTTSLGNMVPAMTTSAIVSFLGTPASGATVGSVLMGTSAYGNAKHQALTEGNSTLSSTIYGLLIGTSEATLGYFLGKIPGLSQTTGFTLKSLLCEGVEEYSQTWIDAGLQAVVLGNDVDWSSIPEEAKDSFIMGMLMSGFLNGGQSIINVTINGLSCEINVDAILEYLEKNPSASMQEALEKSSPSFSYSLDNTEEMDLESKLNEYTDLLNSDPILIETLNQELAGETITIPDNLLDTYLRFKKLYFELSKYSENNTTENVDNQNTNMEINDISEEVYEEYFKMMQDKESDEYFDYTWAHGNLNLDASKLEYYKNLEKNLAIAELKLSGNANYIETLTKIETFYNSNFRNNDIDVFENEIFNLLYDSNLNAIVNSQASTHYKNIIAQLETYRSEKFQYYIKNDIDVGKENYSKMIKSELLENKEFSIEEIKYFDKYNREKGYFIPGEVLDKFEQLSYAVELDNWVNNDMINKMESVFGSYVSREYLIARINQSFRYLTDETFSAAKSDKYVSAYNNGTNSTINLKYGDRSENILKSYATHESIHQISFNQNTNIPGISEGGKNGINETVTEYLTQQIMGSDYPVGNCGYEASVFRLKTLVNEGIISDADIKLAYFTNDLSIITNKIKEIIPEQDFCDNLYSAFNDAISCDRAIRQDGLNKLDKLIIEIINKK